MATDPEPQATHHVLVFPFPAQGHMLPLLDLVHQLAVRSLSVTVVVTPGNLPLLDPLLSRSPTVQTLVLPLPPHPSLPAGVENVKDLLSGGSSAAIAHALRPLHHPILAWARSHHRPVTTVLSDFFLGWTQHLADDLAVPRLTFYSSGALLISVLDHLWLNVRREDTDQTAPVHFPTIPGSPSFPYLHLPSVYRRYRKGVPEFECMRDGMIANIFSWGAVFNTFDALEGVYLDHLRKQYGHDRVWAVGPILPGGSGGSGGSGGATNRGGRSSVPVEEVTAWLDSMPAASVVYVCFGSQFALTPRQGAALASGLEQSGVRFVWGVREEKSAGTRAVVPEGFEERTAGRGLVIRGWAPQVAVLSHEGVGSFVTHCGWNSVLEGLVAGVALLAWPMEADQFVNARLLVEELGVGVRVCEGADSVPDGAELARVLAESVDGRSWPVERERAAEMGRRAAEAEGGSSWKDVEALVLELKRVPPVKANVTVTYLYSFI